VLVIVALQFVTLMTKDVKKKFAQRGNQRLRQIGRIERRSDFRASPLRHLLDVTTRVYGMTFFVGLALVESDGHTANAAGNRAGRGLMLRILV